MVTEKWLSTRLIQIDALRPHQSLGVMGTGSNRECGRSRDLGVNEQCNHGILKVQHSLLRGEHEMEQPGDTSQQSTP